MLNTLRRYLAGRTLSEDREPFWKMLGEFFRELGVLVIVFYPIEGELRNRPHGKLTIVVAGIVLLAVGIVIERRR